MLFQCPQCGSGDIYSHDEPWSNNVDYYECHICGFAWGPGEHLDKYIVSEEKFARRFEELRPFREQFKPKLPTAIFDSEGAKKFIEELDLFSTDLPRGQPDSSWIFRWGRTWISAKNQVDVLASRAMVRAGGYRQLSSLATNELENAIKGFYWEKETGAQYELFCQNVRAKVNRVVEQSHKLYRMTDDVQHMGQLLVIKDLNISPENRKFIEKCFDVWKRGFGLVQEVEGMLYVCGVVND